MACSATAFSRWSTLFDPYGAKSSLSAAAFAADDWKDVVQGFEGKVSIAVQLFGPSSSSQKKDYRSPTNESMHPNGVICRFCEPERYSRLALVGTGFSGSRSCQTIAVPYKL